MTTPNHTSQILLPAGARIHTLPIKGKNSSSEEVENDLILINFPENENTWEKALAWAEATGLKKTVPGIIFAVGEQHPKLRQTLNQKTMYVVATTEYTEESEQVAWYHVWWGGIKSTGKREIGPRYSDDARSWYAFHR